MKLYYITIAVLTVIGFCLGSWWSIVSNPSLPTWLFLICMVVWMIIVVNVSNSVYEYCKEKQWKN